MALFHTLVTAISSKVTRPKKTTSSKLLGQVPKAIDLTNGSPRCGSANSGWLQKMGGKNARMLFQDNEKSKLEYVKSGIKYIKHHFTKSNCLKLWDAPCWCAAFCQANQLLINPEPRRGKWVSHGFFECWLQIFSLLQSDTSRSFGDVVVHLLGQKISSKCLKAQSHGTSEFETGKIE